MVDDLLQTCGLRAEDSIYVLGDDSIFYILLNKRPPYIINSYNDSPLYEQQNVLDGLTRNPPRFVIWATHKLEYDTVPNTVRLPSLYTYVVEHYRFMHAVGPYHILVERLPNQQPDPQYWRRMLGDRIDLGHIPARARRSEYPPCNEETSGCGAVLVVSYPPSRPVRHSSAIVDIDSPSGPFRIQFDLTPDDHEYVINLNRMWFWALLSKSPPRAKTEDGAAAAIIGYRIDRASVLY